MEEIAEDRIAALMLVVRGLAIGMNATRPAAITGLRQILQEHLTVTETCVPGPGASKVRANAVRIALDLLPPSA
jgi:hypothetical protein